MQGGSDRQKETTSHSNSVPSAGVPSAAVDCSKPSASPSSALPQASSIDVAHHAFKNGIESFRSLIDALVASVDRDREALKRDSEELEREKKLFNEEKERVNQVLKANEQVTLNVGGLKYTTTVMTLRNAPSPSLFSAMFSGRHSLRPSGSDGSIFIDRDGRHFAAILNFLRDGQLNYPPDGTDFKYLLELRAEAEYYGLCGMVSQIDRYPYSVTRVQRAAALNVEDSWMYEDGQDEVVLTVDRPCQLLGVGLCGTEGGLTVELDVFEVDPDDFSNELSKLSSAAQSFTKADGQMLKMMLPAPASLLPGKIYMLSALIKGNESYCCEECLETVIAAGVKVQFQCWESPNGTNEMRGQFPEIYVRVV